MQIIPVIDLMGGAVVHGIAGRRHEYRSIVSRLTGSSQPSDVAEAFRTHFGFNLLYVADLDAIAGAAAAVHIYSELKSRGFALWVDAGVGDMQDAMRLATTGIDGIVAGLETVAGPDTLRALVSQFGAERMVFSLDLRDGKPLGNLAGWHRAEPEAIAAEAIALGVKELIVLDLARVGTGTGPGSETLCRQLARAFPHVRLIAGGGVRGPADLDRLRSAGVHAALVASALHDGRLAPVDAVADLPLPPAS